MTSQVQEWPFDLSGVDKGDAIPASECEIVLGVRRDDDRYRLAMMKLKGDVEKRLAALGKPMTVRIHRDGLRFLTDAEAAEHNGRREPRRAERLMVRASVRNAQVDRRNLTNEERRLHEQDRLRNAMKLQALRKAGVEARKLIKAHKRATPPMFPLAENEEKGR